MSLEARIKKKYGDFTLDVVLTAGAETLALLGGSGCGKSLTLRCIAGIETPDEGRIVVDDTVFFDSVKHINLTPQQRRAGLLFQNYALFPNMTARANVAAGIRASVPRAEKERLAGEYLERLHIDDVGDRLPYQLSGGQQQRVALARILIGSPRILMLDEPFSALDSYLRWEMEKEVRRTLGSFGGTTVLVSHSRDEVFRLSDRIAVYNRGRVEVLDSRDEVFGNPRTYTTALLTGCKNFSDAEVSDGRVKAKDWKMEFSVPGAGEGDCIAIRGHFLVPADGEGENTYPYEILDAMEDTFEYVLTIRLRGREDAAPLYWMMTKDEYRDLPKTGYVHFPAGKFMLLRK